MPLQASPGYLKYRVLDSNTGAVIVPDLWHLKQSTWTVRAPQGGMPGSSTIGEFVIRLPPPQSEAGKANAAVYAKLAVGQKVEAYLGDVIAGKPKFSGVITKMNKPLASSWEVIGADTLWWLQQSQLFNGENFGYSSANPAAFVQALLGMREVVWDDDFSAWGTSNHPNLSDYTVVSGTWATALDPIFGLPAISTTSAGSSVISGNTAWAIGQQYNADSAVTSSPAACSIKAQGVMQPGTNGVGQECAFGVVALVSGSQMLLAEGVARQTALAPFYTWAIDARIWTSDGAGAFTQRAQVQNVFTYNAQGNPTPSIPIEVEMTLNTGERIVRVMVNGNDSTCIWGTDKTLLAASGRVGMRVNLGGGGVPRVFYNRLRFESRTAQRIGGWGTDRFQQGTLSVGGTMAPAVIMGSQQSHLDMILMSSAYDGFQIRKTPGAGYKADTIDYTSSPGTDLSNSIVFEEGVNVREDGTMIAPLSDLFAHATRVNAIPGGGGTSGGQITSAPLQTAGSMVVMDSISDLGLANYQTLMAYARIVAGRKANVMQAIQVEIIRTTETADKWRELDYVTIHIPTLGIFRQRVQILGYTFADGASTQVLYLNQYPDSALIQHQIGRLVRCLEFIGTTYARR